MRVSTSVLIVAFSALAVPASAHADCALFPPDGAACVTSKPKLPVDFAKLATLDAETRKRLAETLASKAAGIPTDCKMVKPIDPQFVSKMPIQTPDPKVKLPIATVPVPSCQPKDVSRERR